MFPSTLPQEIITNIHYSRRLLLHSQPPTPIYQVLDPGSSHGNTNGFDANIIMILAGLVCALVCSLCMNFVIRCVIKCLCLIIGRPNYYLNVINYEKRKASGLDKKSLKTFPVVKYAKDLKIKGLSTECVICLSEFKGGEKLRILPICNHGFHVKCIDKWLSSHTSCPTCRQSLVDTCKKDIKGGDDHQATSTPPPPPPPSFTPSRDVIVSIVPLEKEDFVRNYRGEVAMS